MRMFQVRQRSQHVDHPCGPWTIHVDLVVAASFEALRDSVPHGLQRKEIALLSQIYGRSNLMHVCSLEGTANKGP